MHGITHAYEGLQLCTRMPTQYGHVPHTQTDKHVCLTLVSAALLSHSSDTDEPAASMDAYPSDSFPLFPVPFDTTLSFVLLPSVVISPRLTLPCVLQANRLASQQVESDDAHTNRQPGID